jgi:MtN3 and saliva related transmembrane protein
MDQTTFIGSFAAVCTTASHLPQLKKCWETNSAGDLSLKMFSVLAVGIALWVLYGFLQSDWVIVLANSVSFCCLMGILYFKMREMFTNQSTSGPKEATSSSP